MGRPGEESGRSKLPDSNPVVLVSSAIDLVRPPMKELIEGFLARGGKILACPPCVKVRGYTQERLIDGVTIVGSSALHALIKQGAATLSF